MNEPQLAIRTLFLGLALCLALVALAYAVNQLTILFTGTPLVTVFENGSVQVLGRSAGCLISYWGCATGVAP